MCGILGHFSNEKISTEAFKASLGKLEHRGPDNQITQEYEQGFLGHARLAIIDLDSCANQPFSVDDRYQLVFNGEIYNFHEIRNLLESRYHVVFNTSSDTEVLLRAYIQMGKDCLSLLNGMFAFAILDKKQKSLFAARDRVGKKPLFYYVAQNSFCFASELKSLLPLVGPTPELDRYSVCEYLSIGYIIAPRTIYQQVRKVEPAHWLEVDLNTYTVKKERYWDPYKNKKPFDSSHVRSIIEDAVNIRYNADVPVGIMLSGGLDSNIVLSLSKEKKPKTFTIKNKQAAYDESDVAAAAAEYYGCENTMRTAEPDASDLDTIVYHFDEPMADSSAVATHLLSKMISENGYRCVLNGDGADEVFGGYDRYKLLLIYEKFRWLNRFIPGNLFKSFKYKGFFYNLKKLKSILSEKSIAAAWASQNMINKNFQGPALKDIDYGKEIVDRVNAIKVDGLNKFIAYDFKYNMPDDLLVKMDRATMANSLESRSPFLDYRLAEIMLSVRFQDKIDLFKNKKHLRSLFGKILPKEILKRRKTGFQIPIDHWFLNELRDEVLALKSPEANIVKQGFVDPAYVHRIVDAHLAKRENNKFEIYILLIFEKWYSRWAKK